MRVLFIQFNAPRATVQQMSPGLLAVAGLVAKIPDAHIALKVLQWVDLTADHLAECIRAARADIVALPVYSDGAERIEQVLRDLRHQNMSVPVVVGGPHIEAVGDSFLRGGQGIYRCTQGSSAGIQACFSGAASSAGNKSFHTAICRAAFEPGLRAIRYDILETLLPGTWQKLRPVIVTTLGCDRHCTFCAEGTRSVGVRYRAPECIRDELSWIASNTDFPYVMIADDNALVSRDHARIVTEILNEIVTRYPRLRFFLLARPDDVVAKKDVVRALPAENVLRVQIGIESGCPSMRQRYGKVFSNETVREAVAILNDVGIGSVVGSFILGGPYEDDESLAKTERLVGELVELAPGVFEPAFAFLRPYPGTRILEMYPGGLKRIPGLRIGNTTEERPLLQTPACSEVALINAHDALWTAIRNMMVPLFDRVSFSEWVQRSHYESQFLFESAWLRFFKEAANCRAALDLARLRGWVDVAEMSFEEALTHRPRCTVKVPSRGSANGARLPFGRAKVADLSASTIRLLSFCNGERTLSQINRDFLTDPESSGEERTKGVWATLKKLTEGLLVSWEKP